MDLFSKNDIKVLLDNYGSEPSKGLGQNFLINRGISQRIIESADIKPTDTILEVGPGVGNLTLELAKTAKEVLCVEKDAKMAEILKETLKDSKNTEVLVGDILKLEAEVFPKIFKIVANLPYYITSPVIRKFLELDKKPDLMILMIQKEVAQRICSKPPNMNLLAVSVQFYALPKIISYVKKENFWPKPKVDSAIIKIIPKNGGYPVSPDIFFRVVKAGFSQPRKQLGNNLPKMLELGKENISQILKENNIDPKQRAETLKLEDWINLSKSLKI